jgi:hypothetical protein
MLKSPAPEANEDLPKAKFYIEMTDAKNAPAFSIRGTERLAAWNVKATINNDNVLV